MNTNENSTGRYWYPTGKACWGVEEHEAIQRVIGSGRFTMGAEVEAFEVEFAAYHGMNHAIMVNSGSSANLVAVAALFHVKQFPLRRGYRAVVPALAWATTYAPLAQNGLHLILSDCGADWNASKLPPFVEHDIHLIVAASILGNPCDVHHLEKESYRNEAYLIEDNCESVGAHQPYGLCGTSGIMNTFSFFYSHQLSAIEGGMILTDDEECAGLCRLLRNHGWNRKTDGSFNDEYRFELMGYNLRPLEIHAAIAREQLKKLDAMRVARAVNADIFRETCLGLPTLLQEKKYVPNPFGFAFEVESGERRDALVMALRAAGIDCRPPVGGSFRRQPFGIAWVDQQTPNADRIHDRGIFLGCFASDMSREIEEATKIMRQVL